MGKVKSFLDSKIVKTDVGEESYLTWRETISYAVGRGAQGMNTSMTSSKYVNYFLTNVLFKKLKDPMGTASTIRLFCGILMQLMTRLWASSLIKQELRKVKCVLISNGRRFSCQSL